MGALPKPIEKQTHGAKGSLSLQIDISRSYSVTWALRSTREKNETLPKRPAASRRFDIMLNPNPKRPRLQCRRPLPRGGLELDEKLKVRAERHPLSVDVERLTILEGTLTPSRKSVEGEIAEVEALNDRIGTPFDSFIEEEKRDGLTGLLAITTSASNSMWD